MAICDLVILGTVRDETKQKLKETIGAMVADFGLALGSDVVFHETPATIRERDPQAPCAIAFFCGATVHVEHEQVARDLAARQVPVIPVVGLSGDFASEVPPFLRQANGLRLRADDRGMQELAAALLECAGLLRPQRRVFISYRRAEASAAAIQMHDLLASRGFDAFLDTHDIRPAEPFQEVLWHRLCDSDVLVMLDTPGYFDSKWTEQEYTRARVRNIVVLRVVWPDHTPSRVTELSESIPLTRADLSQGGTIVDDTANAIVSTLERVRSRSIAARYRELIGRFGAEVGKLDGRIEGIGAHGAIAVRFQHNDRRIWAYPAIGIPTAETLNDVVNKAGNRPYGVTPILIYDHIGLSKKWRRHLEWLNDNIREVKAIEVANAGWDLSGEES